jgi:hypothetical protein
MDVRKQNEGWMKMTKLMNTHQNGNKWFAGLLLSMVSVVAFGLSMVSAQTKSQQDKPPAIAVTSFDGRKLPIGYLGVPLGTVVRVTGVAIDGDTTRMKANMGKTLLRIESVDGKKLDKSVDFDFDYDFEKTHKPKPDDRFDYYVHEYGAFNGVVTPPKELGIQQVMMANTGFHYSGYITIHKVNLKQK